MLTENNDLGYKLSKSLLIYKVQYVIILSRTHFFHHIDRSMNFAKRLMDSGEPRALSQLGKQSSLFAKVILISASEEKIELSWKKPRDQSQVFSETSCLIIGWKISSEVEKRGEEISYISKIKWCVLTLKVNFAIFLDKVQ